MTEVLQSPSPFPSPSSSSTACTPPTPNDGSNPTSLIDNPTAEKRVLSDLRSEQEEEEQRRKRKERNREADQLSILALLFAALRKSLIGCSNIDCGELSSMEIGCPSNVRHVAHVTFDRFNGFLGLPVEFEPEVPRRAPSASANVFGVSTESMQLSFDSRGNSVPTILLLMQRRLYGQGGLQAEGIFRINAENSQEEYVRDELNGGVVPNGIEVHCLAGLIKAWFRELPTGIMDSLSPEQVMQSQTEEECAQLVRLLPPTEAALLDWAINLMADVAELENLNKMNARNVAMVFAPNMTQHADPLTALRYAVQVMNFLKILIIRTLREREHSMVEAYPMFHIGPPDENDYQRFCSPFIKETKEECNEGNEVEKQFVNEEPALGSPQYSTEEETTARNGSQNSSSPLENTIPGGSQSLVDNCPCEVVTQVSLLANGLPDSGLTHPATEAQTNKQKSKTSQSNTSNCRKGSKKLSEQLVLDTLQTTEMNKTTLMLGRINSRHELVEAWR